MLADLVPICQCDSHTFGLFVMYKYFDTFRLWFFANLTFFIFVRYFFLSLLFRFLCEQMLFRNRILLNSNSMQIHVKILSKPRMHKC
jgi:hypothetical protein